MVIKIVVDEEGQKMIQGLCDIALKYGGVSCLNSACLVLNSMKLLPKEEKEEKKEEKDEKGG